MVGIRVEGAMGLGDVNTVNGRAWLSGVVFDPQTHLSLPPLSLTYAGRVEGLEHTATIQLGPVTTEYRAGQVVLLALSVYIKRKKKNDLLLFCLSLSGAEGNVGSSFSYTFRECFFFY